jgi:Fur family ferric uptake transcriptional regulator
MDNDKVLEIVNQKFTEYLIANNYRKTQERYAILNLIYSDHRHFDMDSLYDAMTEQNFRVSRATLYNTMQLLLECNLVLKHQFGQNISLYERAYNNELHHHLICTNCHMIREYKNTELKSIIQSKKVRNFTPSHYSLYVFGTCNSCGRRIKVKNKQLKINNMERR